MSTKPFPCCYKFKAIRTLFYMRKNRLFTSEELIMNKSFNDFVLKGIDPDQKWNSIIHAYPELTTEVEKAKTIIVFLSKATSEGIGIDKQIELNRLKIRINAAEISRYIPTSWFKYAAMLLLFLGILWLIKADFIQYKKIVAENSNRNVILSDSTHICLKKGSSLKVSRFYDFINRNLHLTGEAFFKVSRNEKMAFKVKTSSSTVCVLGTQFMIIAEPMKTEVLVKEGKVALKSTIDDNEVYLTQGMSAQANKNGQIKNTEFNVNELGFATGEFQFNHVSLNEILKKLENYYSIKFVVAPEYQNRILSFYVSEMSVEDLMQFIKELIPELEYQIKENQIDIY